MAKRRREQSFSATLEQDIDGAGASSLAQSITLDNHTPKYSSVDETEEKVVIRCLLPPHKPVGFETFDDYERHHEHAHTNRCLECQSNFPSSHLLDLHIAENHDPIEATRRQNGDKTYRCFVEDCEKLCQDWKKRRSHLVDKHHYPRNYDFFIVDSGIDGRRSMLRAGVDADGHRGSSRERGRGTSKNRASEPTAPEQKPQWSDESDHSEAGTMASVDDLTKSLSAFKMVPRSVTFGRRKGQSGLARE